MEKLVVDLGRLEAAEEPKSQRDLRRQRESGVAAAEDQAQSVVLHGALLVRLAWLVQGRGLGVGVIAGSLAVEAVDRPGSSRGDDPSLRA